MALHSSTFAWKIPWAEEPGRLQSMGSLGVGHDFTFTFTFLFHALEKEMATQSTVLAWRIPGMEEPGGLPSMGSQRVGYIEQLILKCLSGTDQPLCHVGLVYMFGYGSHISEPPALRTGPLPHTGMSCLREHGPLASD